MPLEPRTRFMSWQINVKLYLQIKLHETVKYLEGLVNYIISKACVGKVVISTVTN